MKIVITLFKWIVISLATLFLILVTSVVVTKIILQNSAETNSKTICLSESTIGKEPIFRSINKMLYHNIKYPKELQENNISGDVKLYFTLYKNGEVNITKIEGEERLFPVIEASVEKSFPYDVTDMNLSFPIKNISILFRFK